MIYRTRLSASPATSISLLPMCKAILHLLTHILSILYLAASLSSANPLALRASSTRSLTGIMMNLHFQHLPNRRAFEFKTSKFGLHQQILVRRWRRGHYKNLAPERRLKHRHHLDHAERSDPQTLSSRIGPSPPSRHPLVRGPIKREPHRQARFPRRAARPSRPTPRPSKRG